ncbi:MAG: triple tyrosine motif-containing protein [Paludibaculum sp.]
MNRTTRVNPGQRVLAPSAAVDHHGPNGDANHRIAQEIAITTASRVLAITRERSGRLWISIEGKGVYRLNGASWNTLESLGGPKGSALAAFTDSTGRTWFGFQNATVAVVEGDALRTFSRKDGLPAGSISSFQDSGPNVWLGGNNGVTLFSGGRFHPVAPADGGEFTGITGMIASSGLWLNERRGIIHIPTEEVKLLQSDPRHRAKFELFDLRDGLPQQRPGSIASPSAIQTNNGLLWFATPGGLVWIDPKRIPRNALPPPVAIETLVAEGRTYGASAPLALPAHTANLNITYTALSLAIPERVQFRYLLEGVDRAWQEVGTRREAFYNNLGPGSYRFRVLACNNDGVWNETGAALEFSIAPAYYQTWWFAALCGLAALAGLWSLDLLRVRQVTAQLHERLGERLAERERIARDLHDTLLQSVQGLMLHFHAVLRKLPGEDPLRPVIENALRTADQVVVEGRDRVRGLRAAEDSQQDLALLLSRCGEEFSNTSKTSFRMSIVGTPCILDPIVRDEVVAIGREALVNAFRHAQAAAVEVEITYDRSALRLRVRDDGKGIDQRTLDKGMPGHWGLSGMRERAQKLAGHLNLWSRPGAGTELDLSIPAKVAYPRTPRTARGEWFKRWVHRGPK